MSNANVLIPVATVILSAAFSYLISRSESRKSNRTSSLSEIYKNVVFPIYDLIFDDLQDMKQGHNATDSEEYIEYIKQKILQTLKRSGGTYTHSFYKTCSSISVQSYARFCKFIEKNYLNCVSLLDYHLPYEYYGESEKKAKAIFWISLSISIMSYMAIFIIPHNINILIATSSLFIASSIIASITVKVYF